MSQQHGLRTNNNEPQTAASPHQASQSVAPPTNRNQTSAPANVPRGHTANVAPQIGANNFPRQFPNPPIQRTRSTPPPPTNVRPSHQSHAAPPFYPGNHPSSFKRTTPNMQANTTPFQPSQNTNNSYQQPQLVNGHMPRQFHPQSAGQNPMFGYQAPMVAGYPYQPHMGMRVQPPNMGYVASFPINAATPHGQPPHNAHRPTGVPPQGRSKPRPLPKKKKSPLAIIDPKTGKPISYSPKTSSSPSPASSASAAVAAPAPVAVVPKPENKALKIVDPSGKPVVAPAKEERKQPSTAAAAPKREDKQPAKQVTQPKQQPARQPVVQAAKPVQPTTGQRKKGISSLAPQGKAVRAPPLASPPARKAQQTAPAKSNASSAAASAAQAKPVDVKPKAAAPVASSAAAAAPAAAPAPVKKEAPAAAKPKPKSSAPYKPPGQKKAEAEAARKAQEAATKTTTDTEEKDQTKPAAAAAAAAEAPKAEDKAEPGADTRQDDTVESDNDVDDDDDDDTEDVNLEEMARMQGEKTRYTIAELMAVNQSKFCRRPPDRPVKVEEVLPGYKPQARQQRGGGGRNSGQQWQRGGGRNMGGNNYGRNDRRGGYDRNNRNNNNRYGGRDRRQQGGRHGGRNGRNYQAPMDIGPIQALEITDKGFKAGMKKDKKTEILGKINSILNKLTLDKFDVLKDQLVTVIKENIGTADDLNEVVGKLFDKALMEAFFAQIYADLCVSLSNELPEFMEDDAATGKKFSTTFKRILLTKCQSEFEMGKVDVEEKDLSPEDLKFAKRKQKTRLLGNIRFIGELYKRKMISERIMHSCIQHLVMTKSPQEEDIESLGKLLSTIGKTIDRAKSKAMIDMYFKRIKVLSKDKKLSSRHRFMLMDVIELRRRRWVPRVKQAEVKTLAQVHREHERETAKNQRPGRGRNDRGGSGRDRSRFGHQDIRQPSRRTDIRRRTDRYSKLGGQSPASRAGSSTSASGRPTARTLQRATPTPKPQQPPPQQQQQQPRVSEEQKQKAEKQFRSAINEYWSARDKNEVKLCMEEAKAPHFHFLFVAEAVKQALEKTPKEQPVLLELLVFLHEKKVLGRGDFSPGLCMVMKGLPDLMIDAPRAKDFLADLLLGLVDQGILSFDIMRIGTKALRAAFQLEIVFRSLAKAMVKHEHADKLINLWQDSLIPFTFCLSEKTKVKDFVERFELHKMFPFGVYRDQLKEMLNAGNSVAEINAWLENDVPAEVLESTLARLDILYVVAEHAMLSSGVLDGPAPTPTATDKEQKTFECYVGLVLQYPPPEVRAVQEMFKVGVSVKMVNGVFARLVRYLLQTKIIKSDSVFKWLRPEKPILDQNLRNRAAGEAPFAALLNELKK